VLQGVIERVTYRDPESLYTVLRLSPEAGYGDPAGGLALFGSRTTAVGLAPAPPALPELVGGLRVRLAGTWTEHPSHGRQFRFDEVEVLPPLDRAGLERYLASDLFPGVGPTLAARVVEALGPNALAVIRETPERLGAVRGLRPAVRAKLVERVQAELGSQELAAFLLGLGLGPWQVQAIARKLGADAERLLRANPWLLAHGIPGIGFQTADRCAMRLGRAPEAPERRRAGLVHLVRHAAQEGHTLVRAGALRERLAELLSLAIEPDAFEADLAALETARELVVARELEAPAPDDRAVYLPMLHASERGLADNLLALHGVAAEGRAPLRPLATPAELARAESELGLALHPDQRAAVLGLLAHPVALLTGGPGVGKTTIVRLVAGLAEAAGARVELASPTGRAAKRLAEATGREARTVHRLLGFEPGRRAAEGAVGGRFAHHGRNPLEADLVIVDEISMLDVVLAHHLVKAIQPPTRLVLVGDPDQLPSVSAGNVLADLLACGRLPVFRLSRVFRQDEDSGIVANAHRILAGETPRFPERATEGSDFFFFPAEGDEAAAELLVDVVARRLPKRFELDWIEDVQVLAPMYRGPCGVDALNARLREALAHGGREIAWRGRTWRVGDRVIHTRNDYEKEVFNGDMGRILSIAADGTALVVRFPERDVAYAKEEFGDLAPAFAITVHRSQGGEFPAVVMPLVTSHFLMLQRHLLYTAVTRAKRLVVLVGSRRALDLAVANDDPRARESGLAERLRGSAADAGPTDRSP